MIRIRAGLMRRKKEKRKRKEFEEKEKLVGIARDPALGAGRRKMLRLEIFLISAKTT